MFRVVVCYIVVSIIIPFVTLATVLAKTSMVGVVFFVVVVGFGEIGSGVSADGVATGRRTRGRRKISLADEDTTGARLGPPQERGEHLIVGGPVYKVQPAACKKIGGSRRH
jgi:hypothetical protein